MWISAVTPWSRVLFLTCIVFCACAERVKPRTAFGYGHQPLINGDHSLFSIACVTQEQGRSEIRAVALYLGPLRLSTNTRPGRSSYPELFAALERAAQLDSDSVPAIYALSASAELVHLDLGADKTQLLANALGPPWDQQGRRWINDDLEHTTWWKESVSPFLAEVRFQK